MNELVHFKMCELNFELVHAESELSQHCRSIRSTPQNFTIL